MMSSDQISVGTATIRDAARRNLPCWDWTRIDSLDAVADAVGAVLAQIDARFAALRAGDPAGAARVVAGWMVSTLAGTVGVGQPPIPPRPVWFCDLNNDNHLYVGTEAQYKHLADVDGGAPRRVVISSIHFHASDRASFFYEDRVGIRELIADAAFSIAPLHWSG